MPRPLKIIVTLNLIFYLTFAATINLPAQMTKKTIAVLNLEAREGISKSGAATLTDRLRSELVNLESYIVLERGRMDDILKEQGFNQSGCTSSECAVEAGKLLGVQQMVAGEIGKVGNVLTLDIRMIDVETGKILNAYQFDYKGDASGLLTLIKDVAAQLAKVDNEKGFPWLWVGLGAVVIGGTAAFLLSSSESGSSTSSEEADLPDPMWPPQ